MSAPQTPGEATSNADASADPSLCPRCGGKLTNPDSLGWCAKCGYCRSLEQDPAKMDLPAAGGAAARRAQSPLGVVEFFELLAKLPRWFWILTFGSVLVLAGVYGLGFFIPLDEESERMRAMWCTAVLAGGLLLLQVGQLWALFMLAPRDDRLGAKDAIVPFRLWSFIVKRLPSTDKQLWLIGWGMSAMIGSVLFIGGLDYWGELLAGKKKPKKELVAAAAKLEKGGEEEKELTDAAKDAAKAAELKDKIAKDKKDKEKPKDDRRPTSQCVIIGYAPGAEDGTLSSIVVLVYERNDFLPVAGQVRKGLDTPEAKNLLTQLKPLEQPDPVPGYSILRNTMSGITWVKPKIFCAVHRDNVDKAGRLGDNPSFGGILK